MKVTIGGKKTVAAPTASELLQQYQDFLKALNKTNSKIGKVFSFFNTRTKNGEVQGGRKVSVIDRNDVFYFTFTPGQLEFQWMRENESSESFVNITAKSAKTGDAAKTLAADFHAKLGKQLGIKIAAYQKQADAAQSIADELDRFL